MNESFCDPLWEAFYEGHPLRIFCSSFSIFPYYQAAELLVQKILQYIERDLIIPYSPDLIENYLTQRGIIIEDKIVDSSMLECSRFFLSACEPENRLITLYPKAIMKQAERISISAQEARAILLSHEWFHIIFFESGASFELVFFSESERINIEEVAARMFAIRILGYALHPTVLDGESPPAGFTADSGQRER